MRSVSLLDVAPLAADRVRPFEGRRPYLATGGVGDEAEYTPTAVTYADRPTRADLCVQPGDVSFARMQGTKKILEFNEEHADLILSTGFAVLRPYSTRLHPGYLRHWLYTDAFQFAKDRLCSGATQRAITNEKLEQLTIPLPERVDEQRRIAEILDKADAMLAKRRAALAQLDTLTQSIFLDMFGDPATNPQGWPIAQMGDVCDVRDGTHDSPKYISSGGYPLVTSKNVTGGIVDLTDVNYISEADFVQINKRSKVDCGDIILPMIGTIGSPVLVDHEPRYAIKNVALIKFTKTSPSAVFVRQLLNGDYFDHIVRQKNRGGTQKFVSLGDLRAFPLPLPSKDEQQEFARRVEAVERARRVSKASETELNALSASLQHRAFRGELIQA